jgi:sugar lactone lactonase YvrE
VAENFHADLAADTRCLLGEGPLWDMPNGRIVWTDILANAVYAFYPERAHTVRFDVGEMVTALAPRDAGGFLVATTHGVGVLDLEAGRLEAAAEVESSSTTRMNDGKCDPGGRFWVGSMALDPDDAGIASLYRVDRDLSVTRVLNEVTVSNGMDWTADESAMYYIDSARQRVDVFDFDKSSGVLGARRTLVDIAKEDGLPDGMCVDEDGCIWVALAYAGAVRRYSTEGELLATVEVPTSIVTSCCFGGVDLSDLYVTSAAEYVAEERRALEPHAGGLFRCDVGVHGRPAHAFEG